MLVDYTHDLNGNILSFDGNTTLKSVNQPIPFTMEHVNELIKCKNSYEYFAERYYYILSLDEGMVKVKLRDYQKNMISSFIEERFSIVLASRQCGKSTSYEIFLLWYILFNEQKNVAILANKAETAKGILRKVKLAYELLPHWLKHGVRSWNVNSIELENGCTIIASATSSSAIRSKSINVLVLDEFAFISASVFDAFYSAVYPTISSSQESKIIMVSCVTKDTLVFGENGIQEVSSFINEKKVGAYHTNDYKVLGKIGFNNGNILVNNGVAETKIISTTFGDLECSLEHKLWACKNGKYDWYKAKELSCDDYISIQYGMNKWIDDDDISDITIPDVTKNGRNYNFGNIITKELAYLFGIFIAEGYCREIISKRTNNIKGGQITISCGDDISWAFDALNISYTKYNDVHYNINSKYLMLFLKEIGFDISLKSPKKYIPQRLMRMSKQNIAYMLRGLFDGDGSSRKNRGTVSYASSSKKLLMQIKMLLLNFGIISDYYTGITPITKKAKVESRFYRLEIPRTDSYKFYNEIGFGLKRKQNNKHTLALTKNPKFSHDIIPYSKQLTKKYNLSSLYKNINHTGAKTQLHYSRNTMLNWKHLYEMNPVPNTELKDFFENNVSENLKWYKIKSITSSENEVYDFSLEHKDGDKWCHSVLYNGIIGHQTPNGMNHYYKFWNDAINNRNSFKPMRVDWWEVPGRDEKWKRETIANIGERRFACEYGNDFLSSSFTLIDGKYLSSLTHDEPEEIDEFVLDIDERIKHFIKIYDDPIEGHTYTLSVDSAKMIEDSVGDPISIQIVDVTKMPFQQVATCNIRDGISYLEVPELAIALAEHYNNAYMFIENNEGWGQVIANMIAFDYEYENVFYEKAGIPGYRTTKKTKKLGCSNLKLLVESERLMLKDFETISQLSTFTKHGDTFKADKTYFDDLVMSLIGSIFFMIDKHSINGKFEDTDFVRGMMEKNKQITEEENTMPTAFLDGDEPALDWSWLYK